MHLTIIPKALAQTAPEITVNKPESVKITNIGTLIQGIVQGALLIAALLVFLYLIWGGIQWITSGGDKSKTQEARDRITAALVGLAVVAAAWAVMLIIQYFFGLNILGGQINPPKAW